MPENLSMNCNLNNGTNAKICFASDVLATIAGLSLTEVEGIAGGMRYSGLVADKKTKKNALNIKALTKGVKVEVTDELVSVNISIVAEYGYSVQEVCRNIQENVKKTIETMTGMTVKNVDVHVSGISFDKENRENAEMAYQKYLSDTAADKLEGDTEEQKAE